jgi:hypothetical protein
MRCKTSSFHPLNPILTFLNLHREPTTGGALYAENSSVTLARSNLTGNKITGFRGAAGGALYLVQCTGHLSDNNFTSNVVESTLCRGGALYLNHSAVSIIRSGFINNGINVLGTLGSFATGGAVYAAAKGFVDGIWPPGMVAGKDDDVIDNDEPSVQDGMHLSLEDCWFQNNYITSFTKSYAAAMLLWKLNVTMTRVQILDHLVPKALGTVIMLMCKAVIDHSDFKNNSVAHGGAFYINQHSQVRFNHCSFWNCSGELGGALFFGYGKFHGHSIHGVSEVESEGEYASSIFPRADLDHCSFLDNTDGAAPGKMINSFGGAIFVDGKYDAQEKPVIFTIIVKNSLFSGCKSSSGGALALVGAVASVVSTSQFGASNLAMIGGDHVYAQGSDVSATINSSRLNFSGIAYHTSLKVFSDAILGYNDGTTFHCPNGSLVLQAGSDYMCKPCLAPEYNLWEGVYENGDENPANPNRCFECPFKADCSIVSVPSALNPALVTLTTSVNASQGTYGVVSAGQASFYSCPDGYCCKDDICPSINSCSGNRDPSTLLCGACLAGFSLAVDTPNCVRSELCGKEPEFWGLQMLQWLFWGSLWTYQMWGNLTKQENTDDEAGISEENSPVANADETSGNFFQKAEMATRYEDKDPGTYNTMIFIAGRGTPPLQSVATNLSSACRMLYDSGHVWPVDLRNCPLERLRQFHRGGIFCRLWLD